VERGKLQNGSAGGRGGDKTNPSDLRPLPKGRTKGHGKRVSLTYPERGGGYWHERKTSTR